MTTFEAQTELWEEAAEFIFTCYHEWGESEDEARARLAEVAEEIHRTGTYTHTYEELAYGAKLAWRNSNRCIGRLFWDSMTVFDRREVTDPLQVFDALHEHMAYAWNGGKIRPAISVFPAEQMGRPTMRIWNHQLYRYAGYERDGEVIGDSTSVAFTRICEELGWRGAGTHFDLLPLVVGYEGKQPIWREIPSHLVNEVEIDHPDIEGFSSLGLKWYAIPLISDMKLEVGGITYGTAPFNGWYMGTEIGARNLADEDRYDQLPDVAEVMGIPATSNRSLWKDKALVELNVAVLDSFQRAGVTIVDHHTAAKQFQSFEKKEAAAERPVTGNWTWLIPPLSPATTHVFHKRIPNTIVKPNYFYQKAPY